MHRILSIRKQVRKCGWVPHLQHPKTRFIYIRTTAFNLFSLETSIYSIFFSLPTVTSTPSSPVVWIHCGSRWELLVTSTTHLLPPHQIKKQYETDGGSRRDISRQVWAKSELASLDELMAAERCRRIDANEMEMRRTGIKVIICQQIWAKKWKVSVYMESAPHSWHAFPKEAISEYFWWETYGF